MCSLRVAEPNRRSGAARGLWRPALLLALALPMERCRPDASWGAFFPLFSFFCVFCFGGLSPCILIHIHMKETYVCTYTYTHKRDLFVYFFFWRTVSSPGSSIRFKKKSSSFLIFLKRPSLLLALPLCLISKKKSFFLCTHLHAQTHTRIRTHARARARACVCACASARVSECKEKKIFFLRWGKVGEPGEETDVLKILKKKRIFFWSE